MIKHAAVWKNGRAHPKYRCNQACIANPFKMTADIKQVTCKNCKKQQRKNT